MSNDQKQPLINSTIQERQDLTDTEQPLRPAPVHKELKVKSALIEIFKLAIWPIIGMMFHPLYMMVNAMLLGHLQDKVQLAALGLGGLTVGITLQSITVTFNGSLDTLVAQAHGQ